MKINRSIIALAISSLLIISCKENKEKDNMNEDSMEMNDSSDMSEGNEMSSDDEASTPPIRLSGRAALTSSGT